MVSRGARQQTIPGHRGEEFSGLRPVTLLIATGIALITAVLMVTGIAANHLRQQALLTAGSELARIDGVLAAASNRVLDGIDSRLSAIAEHLVQAGRTGEAGYREEAASPQTAALLNREVERFSRTQGIAVLGRDGMVLNRAGLWPADDRAVRTLAADPPSQAKRPIVLGAPISDPRTGALSIALARRLTGPDGQPLGVIVGFVPVDDFTALFAAVPLPSDAVIGLVEADGVLLARYPAESGGGAPPVIRQSDLAAVFAARPDAALPYLTATQGAWQIHALRGLADYPAAILVGRSANQVLAEWFNQILWLGMFAIIASIAIAIMVYLIARQFKTHADLAAMRAERIEAEKIESENARLAAETELLKAERLSVLGQLTATVAHELRNPLSAIRNTLFTVKELAVNAGLKLDRPIGRMERSIERCDRIISDLLEFTRNRELNRSELRFDRWLADLLSEQSVTPPIELATELGAGDAAVPADPDRIRRVVINLIENAAQALADTAPDQDKRILVRTAIGAGELLLTIQDTGPGIAPENLTRIFEPLFSTKSFGTGLGLPTVKQIVNQHGGTIAIDSELGRGTCVTVRLPLQDAAEAETMRVAA